MITNLAILLLFSFSLTLAHSQSPPTVGPSATPVPEQTEFRSEPCVLATASVDNSVSRMTGSLRSDDHSESQALAQLQGAIKEGCARFSPQALQQVSVTVGENHIVISGTVPSEADEEQLISIAVANADGRTVFNKLGHSAVKPPLR